MPLSTDIQIAQVIAKALHEPGFRSKLMNEPEETLRSMKVSIPDGQSVTVLESNGRETYFILPIIGRQNELCTAV
jgi:hypothetical protein